MNESFKQLEKLFLDIKSMRYIEAQFNDCGAAGKTFEKLINKDLDNKQLADFLGIEIKVSSFINKYPITLFSLFPESYNKTSEESIRCLISNYGYSNNSFIKKLAINVKCNKIKYCKNRFGFMLKISYKWKKIYLCVFHKNKVIDTSFSWSFKKLYIIFEKKLKYLAYVTYFQKRIYSKRYFYYYDMIFYILKSYGSFIKAIEDGIISVSFNISLDYSNILRYHGVNFVIYYKDFNYIYDKICK